MGFSSVSAATGRFRLLLLTLLILAGASGTASQASASLGPATNFAVQDEPSSIAVGDVNGDSFADLAVTNSLSLSVSILLGTASGSFGTATNFPTATGAGRLPISVAIRDLNGDTFPDLVVGVGGLGLASTVQVMLGTGTGSFGTATTFSAGVDPWSVVIGNFTGDSNPDIATANRATDNVSVLAGNGTGSFAAPTNFAVGAVPTSIAAGDLNGDTFPDLVTSNANTNNVSVLLADGLGSFNAATNIPVGNYPFAVAIGKLDGNSSPDIAVANNIDGTVSVLLNNGSGVFDPLPPFPTGSGAGSVAIGDLNSDSFADLAVGNYFGAAVSVLTGNGTGVFGSKVDYASQKPNFVVIGRFGSDALLDLAYANEETDDVSVRLNSNVAPVPDLIPNPETLSFGTQKVGTQSASSTVMIVNNGGAAVPIDFAGVAGNMQDDFPFVSSECDGVLLPPGAACGVTVAFKPSVAGARFAEIVVFPVGEVQPIGVLLSGVGAKAKIGTVTVSGPAKVKKGKRATYRVRVTNSGNATATGVRLKASGRGISFGTSVGTIAAGKSRTVTVKLKPRKPGRIKASFKVTSTNAGGKTANKTITVK